MQDRGLGERVRWENWELKTLNFGKKVGIRVSKGITGGHHGFGAAISQPSGLTNGKLLINVEIYHNEKIYENVLHYNCRSLYLSRRNSLVITLLFESMLTYHEHTINPADNISNDNLFLCMIIP